MQLNPLIQLLNRLRDHLTYEARPPSHPEDITMTMTSTIRIVINSESPNDVEGYVRDCIDNADQEWEIESAEIETSDGVITDLLEDEEDLSDEAIEESGADAEKDEEAGTEEEDTEQTPKEGEPTGKEF
jgi:hypothetical protein